MRKKYCVNNEGDEDAGVCMGHYTIVKGYHTAGLGETVEKILKCKHCGREWREVYIFSCNIDNKTDEVIES